MTTRAAELPVVLSQVRSRSAERVPRSLKMIITCDQRRQSPFLGSVLEKILNNAQANLLLERNLVHLPQQGHQFSVVF